MPLRSCLAALSLVLVVSPALAQTDPLLAVRSADPLELARAADRLGDAAVLARLVEGRPTPIRLAAIRATPWLDAPEQALAPLAAIAIGRDPDLAPAAAVSILRIARALDAQALDGRETHPSELHDARVAIQALADDATARADLRRMAELAVDALAAIGVP